MSDLIRLCPSVRPTSDFRELYPDTVIVVAKQASCQDALELAATSPASCPTDTIDRPTDRPTDGVTNRTLYSLLVAAALTEKLGGRE